MLLAAFFWPRATKAGAVSGMSTGMVVALVWQWQQKPGGLVPQLGGEWLAGVDAVLPALTLSVLVLVTVSLAGKPPEPQTRPEGNR